MKQKNTKKAGFSLIEVLFAMLFLSIIVFGVIKLQTSNLTLSNTKQNELRAYFMAAQGLEIVENLGYGAVSACTMPCYLEKSGDYSLKNSGSESLGDGLFERTITHDEAGLLSASNVTAKVTWTDSSGEHTSSASRIIFN